MSESQIRLNNISQEKGVSNYLTSYSISEYGFDLNKQQFWDRIRLRYGLKLTNLPSMCACGYKIDMQHVMSYRKGDFITIRFKNVRELSVIC